jgi:hypothetical protein
MNFRFVAEGDGQYSVGYKEPKASETLRQWLIQLLAEGEQQRARRLFDAFSVGLNDYRVRRVALILFAPPYAIMSVAFGDKTKIA